MEKGLERVQRLAQAPVLGRRDGERRRPQGPNPPVGRGQRRLHGRPHLGARVWGIEAKQHTEHQLPGHVLQGRGQVERLTALCMRLPARQHFSGGRRDDGRQVCPLVGLPGCSQQGALLLPEHPVTGGQPGTKQGHDAGDAGAFGIRHGLCQKLFDECRMIDEVQGTGPVTQRHDIATAGRGLQKHAEWITTQVQGHAHPGNAARPGYGRARRCTAGTASGPLETSPSPRHRWFWLHMALGMEHSHRVSRALAPRRALGHLYMGTAQSLTAWSVSMVVTPSTATSSVLS